MNKKWGCEVHTIELQFRILNEFVGVHENVTQ